MPTGEMRIMDKRHGDLKVMWDSDKPDEIAAARKQFDELKLKGYLAFSVDKRGDKGEVITKFDPQAEKIILAPQMRGGAGGSDVGLVRHAPAGRAAVSADN